MAGWTVRQAKDVMFYRDCQKNVPIEDRFSATNPYVAILFSERYYDKRYKCANQLDGQYNLLKKVIV